MPAEMPIVVLGQCVVLIQVAPPTEHDLRRAGEVVQTLRRDGRPIGVMVVVDTKMPMLDASTREHLGRFIKRIGPMCAGIQVALRGSGFWAAAMRGIATVLATGSSVKMGVTSSEREALQALAEDVTEGLPSEDALASALAEHGLSF